MSQELAVPQEIHLPPERVSDTDDWPAARQPLRPAEVELLRHVSDHGPVDVTGMDVVQGQALAGLLMRRVLVWSPDTRLHVELPRVVPAYAHDVLRQWPLRIVMTVATGRLFVDASQGMVLYRLLQMLTGEPIFFVSLHQVGAEVADHVRAQLPPLLNRIPLPQGRTLRGDDAWLRIFSSRWGSHVRLVPPDDVVRGLRPYRHLNLLG